MSILIALACIAILVVFALFVGHALDNQAEALDLDPSGAEPTPPLTGQAYADAIAADVAKRAADAALKG